MTGLNTDGRALTVDGRGVQAGAVSTGAALEWTTETDYAEAVDRPGTVYDEIADHVGGEAGVAASGYYLGSLVDGLLVYLPLDDSSTGSTATDQTELGIDGTINGATYVGSGQVGSDSLSFDGTDDYVDLGDEVLLDFDSTDSFSVSVWFKTTVTQGPNAPAIIGKEPFDVGYGIGTRTDGDGLFARVDDDTDAAQVEDTTFSYNDGNWHNVVMTVERTSETLELYIDGSSAGTADTSAVGTLGNSSAFRIADADRPSSTDDRLFEGDIDDARVYERPLSPQEITALSNRTATSPVPTEATV